MKTALQHFRQFASEFNSLPDEQVKGWLDSAALFVSFPDPATDKGNLQQALYGAHLCWMDKYQTGAVRGHVTSEQEGDSKRTYSPVGDNSLSLSKYGQQYKALLQGVGIRLPALFTRYGTDC
jgi:hypothetical protein